MTRVDEHRAALAGLDDWLPYREADSGRPGPRGNLEAHVRHVLTKHDIPDHSDVDRRVLAVLTHIGAAAPWGPRPLGSPARGA